MGLNTTAKGKCSCGKCAVCWSCGRHILSNASILGEKLLEQLVAEGKALYPTSALFDCLTPFNEDEDKELIRQLTPAQRKRIREELTEWNLQENMMDREMLESVGDVMDDPEKNK